MILVLYEYKAKINKSFSKHSYSFSSDLFGEYLCLINISYFKIYTQFFLLFFIISGPPSARLVSLLARILNLSFENLKINTRDIQFFWRTYILIWIWFQSIHSDIVNSTICFPTKLSLSLFTLSCFEKKEVRACNRNYKFNLVRQTSWKG